MLRWNRPKGRAPLVRDHVQPSDERLTMCPCVVAYYGNETPWAPVVLGTRKCIMYVVRTGKVGEAPGSPTFTQLTKERERREEERRRLHRPRATRPGMKKIP